MRPLLDMPLHGGRGGVRLPRRPAAQAAARGCSARGLEWLWRLGLEPRRLWRRYLILNPAYLARLARPEDATCGAPPRPHPPPHAPTTFAVYA